MPAAATFWEVNRDQVRAKYGTAKLQSLTLEKLIEIYTKNKGNDFKGLLFTKFSSMHVRDQVVGIIRKELTSKKAWVKPNKQAQKHAVSGFLLSLKRVLVS